MSAAFRLMVSGVLIGALAGLVAPAAAQGVPTDQACCFPGSGCLNLDPCDCFLQGGTPQGPGSDCGFTPCSMPIVDACCFPGGVCVNLDPCDCFLQGGAPQGFGTDCIDFQCFEPNETEACCIVGQSCQDLTPSACIGFGGTPQGPGSNCGSVVCIQPTQACCFSDGSCANLDPNMCNALGGMQQGFGSDCNSVFCPPQIRACCFFDGSCIDTDPNSCLNQGGLPDAPGSDCFTAPCFDPNTQACCFNDGSCLNLNLSACFEAAGTPRGFGTMCETIISCVEACCFPDGSCQNLDPCNCASQGGTPQGGGTDCNGVICPSIYEACCFPDGSCQILDPCDCASQGGTPQGVGTDCNNVACPSNTQACCFSDGDCLNLDPNFCLFVGGAPQGPGTDCNNVFCIPTNEACCLSDGSCEHLEPNVCVLLGGVPQGPFSTCQETICPEPNDPNSEACCLPDDVCLDLTRSECLARGGRPLGGCTTCANDACPKCAGDVNGDGEVTLSDLAGLLSAFGSMPCDGSFIGGADIDGDGDVDLSDLAGLLGQFGVTCPPDEDPNDPNCPDPNDFFAFVIVDSRVTNIPIARTADRPAVEAWSGAIRTLIEKDRCEFRGTFFPNVNRPRYEVRQYPSVAARTADTPFVVFAEGPGTSWTHTATTPRILRVYFYCDANGDGDLQKAAEINDSVDIDTVTIVVTSRLRAVAPSLTVAAGGGVVQVDTANGGQVGYRQVSNVTLTGGGPLMNAGVARVQMCYVQEVSSEPGLINYKAGAPPAGAVVRSCRRGVIAPSAFPFSDADPASPPRYNLVAGGDPPNNPNANRMRSVIMVDSPRQGYTIMVPTNPAGGMLTLTDGNLKPIFRNALVAETTDTTGGFRCFAEDHWDARFNFQLVGGAYMAGPGISGATLLGGGGINVGCPAGLTVDPPIIGAAGTVRTEFTDTGLGHRTAAGAPALEQVFKTGGFVLIGTVTEVEGLADRTGGFVRLDVTDSIPAGQFIGSRKVTFDASNGSTAFNGLSRTQVGSVVRVFVAVEGGELWAHPLAMDDAIARLPADADLWLEAAAQIANVERIAMPAVRISAALDAGASDNPHLRAYYVRQVRAMYADQPDGVVDAARALLAVVTDENETMELRRLALLQTQYALSDAAGTAAGRWALADAVPACVVIYGDPTSPLADLAKTILLLAYDLTEVGDAPFTIDLDARRTLTREMIKAVEQYDWLR